MNDNMQELDPLTITNKYIDIIKENPKYYYEDYKQIVDKVAKSNARYKGKPIPFP